MPLTRLVDISVGKLKINDLPPLLLLPISIGVGIALIVAAVIVTNAWTQQKFGKLLKEDQERQQTALSNAVAKVESRAEARLNTVMSDGMAQMEFATSNRMATAEANIKAWVKKGGKVGP